MKSSGQTLTLGQRITLRLRGDVLPTIGLLLLMTLAMVSLNA